MMRLPWFEHRAPKSVQEAARILGEAIDYARQGEMAARLMKTRAPR